MCGIAGIISLDPASVQLPVLKRMADSLAHRGPDGEGFWISDSGNTGFAARRLSVLDLSVAGDQPMHYMNRYTIVHNGEIYNFRELRNDLLKQGYQFRSNSDTEVILASYDRYKEKCIDHFDGMFAFAIWDNKEQNLFCARDRFGEKPLYYYQEKGKLFFASEMKALWSAGIPRVIDQKILLNYLSLGYVQNASERAQTFFQEIYSLAPSHYFTLNFKTGKFQLIQYWDIDKQATIKITEDEAVEQLDYYLNNSVVRRLRSDVPVGLTLSGGLDSSSICSYMHDYYLAAGKKVKSFSAIFPGFEKDESSYINSVVRYFQIENYHTTPAAYQLAEDFQKMAYHQEEPFASSSIYAQYKVFELARKHNVPVLLDGQGADEIMAGYHKYLHWYLQEVMSRNRFRKLKSERASFSKNKIRVNWGIKNILAAYLPSHAAIALEKNEYERMLKNNDLSKEMLAHVKGREWEGIHKPIITKLNDILYFNTMCNGMEELLRFSDRNAMAHGVEVRLPFLNAELVKFVFSLSSDLKISNGFSKSILRKLMDEKLPPEIVWRTEKVGFEPPQKQWMSDPVMDDLLHESKKKLIHEHILKPSVINKKARPLPAHSRDNFDWRYLCAAWLIS